MVSNWLTSIPTPTRSNNDLLRRAIAAFLFQPLRLLPRFRQIFKNVGEVPEKSLGMSFARLLRQWLKK